MKHWEMCVEGWSDRKQEAQSFTFELNFHLRMEYIFRSQFSTVELFLISSSERQISVDVCHSPSSQTNKKETLSQEEDTIFRTEWTSLFSNLNHSHPLQWDYHMHFLCEVQNYPSFPTVHFSSLMVYFLWYTSVTLDLGQMGISDHQVKASLSHYHRSLEILCYLNN